ncbi:chemokine XC receptor 1 [Alosa alosa]|uniref:chemokine XC receptor 1 n=1 Tax=Alosa alosa TaxID=278164 RepID=UPI0020154941|nr:chemokine XC receptor 1 [Alosa alosa]
MEFNVTPTTDDYYYYSLTDEPVLLEDVIGNFHGIFSAVCYSLIFCVSLAGNSFLLWTILRQEDLRQTSSLLLLHLTVSDLIFTMPLPIWAVYPIHGWVMGEVACRLLSGILFLGYYSYMAFLTAMTVHRYRAVVHAVTASSFKPNVHLLSGVLWVFCLTFSIPEMVFSETVNVYDSVHCIQTYMPEYVMHDIQIPIFFLLPFAVITFCYSRMWFRIRQCRMKKKNQAVRLIFFIVVGFFVCWAPFNIFLFLQSLSLHGLIPAELINSDASDYAYTVSHTLAYSHCCLSPIIHIFGAGKFRGRLSGSFRWLSIRDRAQTLSTHTHETALSTSGPTYIRSSRSNGLLVSPQNSYAPMVE